MSEEEIRDYWWELQLNDVSQILSLFISIICMILLIILDIFTGKDR